MNKIGIVIGIAILLGLVGYKMFPKVMYNAISNPKRQEIIKTPEDYGLKYEEVTLKTEDGVDLAAWLIKGTGDNVIILGHPGTFTRYGYALSEENALAKSGYDIDVEFIPVAKHLVNAGYTILMYDQRNHGKSGASPDEKGHNPAKAYFDTLAAVNYVSNHSELKAKNIGLLSFCQSSFISMVAQSKRGEELRKAGVKAFVALQPISIEIFYRNYGIPEWVINRMKREYEKNGSSMDEQNPLKYSKDIFLPTLFVQNVNDSWSDMVHIEEIFDSIPTEKEAIWIDDRDEKHRFYTYNYFNYYPEKLITFFDKYLK